METWSYWILLMSAAAVCGQDCGVAPLNRGRGRILGGTNAMAGSWPWQASIHHNITGSHICGGTLISAEWILTAASCIENQELNPAPSAFTIYLGWQTQGGPNPNQVKCKVVQIIIHPDYRDALRNNSVALMKLSSPVTFSNYIRPICLASSSSRFSNNTLCWATGWERLNFTEVLPASHPLQEVGVVVIGQNLCHHQYAPVIAQLNITKITDEMMCARQNSRGLCLGDIGGPLQCKQGSVWIQAGINLVALCALVDLPESYNRVSGFQRWITDQVTTADVTFVTFTSSVTKPDSSFVFMFVVIVFINLLCCFHC